MGEYNMFSNLKTPKSLLDYNLFRGTTDYSRLEQFELYEGGYPYLVVVSIPKFLEKMAENDDSIKALVNNYIHILEYEFKGFSGGGLPSIGSNDLTIDNGIQQMSVIGKTTMDSNEFSMSYNEKAGSTLTKMHELYLRSVRDPNTGFKTYNGIIHANGDGNDPWHANNIGFSKECFSFLYMHTDNTGLVLERAAYFVGAMPKTADLTIYNTTKGDIEFKEVSCEFTGYPIMGKAVDARAKAILNHMNAESNAAHVRRNSWNYDYYATSEKGELANAKLTSDKGTIRL